MKEELAAVAGGRRKGSLSQRRWSGRGGFSHSFDRSAQVGSPTVLSTTVFNSLLIVLVGAITHLLLLPSIAPQRVDVMHHAVGGLLRAHALLREDSELSMTL